MMRNYGNAAYNFRAGISIGTPAAERRWTADGTAKTWPCPFLIACIWYLLFEALMRKNRKLFVYFAEATANFLDFLR